jgi:hypothetical protein
MHDGTAACMLLLYAGMHAAVPSCMLLHVRAYSSYRVELIASLLVG